MTTIPFYFILFAYGAFLAIVFIFFLINISSLVRTGTFTLVSFFATFFFLSLSAIVVWTTWNELQTIDWQQPITIWNTAWLSSLLGKVFPIN